MNWLIKACSSSVGKKVLMALTGLALCGFLVVHLGGNLLLYVSPEVYNDYAHNLHEQESLLLIAEIGLLAVFVIHLYLAISLERSYRAARPVQYEMRQSKQDNGPMAAPASAVMYATGLVVLGFILWHLADFRFDLRNPGPTGEDPFTRAARLLTNPWTVVVYLVGSIVLGYHVLHGFQSAFQSLGLNHPKYTPLIRRMSLIFAIVVGVGFASFPLWAIMR